MWRQTSPPTLAPPGDTVALAGVVRRPPETYLECARQRLVGGHHRPGSSCDVAALLPGRKAHPAKARGGTAGT
eukprot:8261896-Alexandrium_andersonii.AAC.1